MIVHNGNIVVNNGRWIIPTKPPEPDPYNPLNLPAYTIRLKYTEGVTPTTSKAAQFTQVSSSPNIWDLTYVNSDWASLLTSSSNDYILEILGANTTNVTGMMNFAKGCNNLTKVALFDTSNVTITEFMFYNCNSLIDVPQFDTSNVTHMYMMFARCTSLPSVTIDASKLTELRAIFEYCSSLTSVNITNTSNVTRMSNLFHNCTSLTSVNSFDTSNVTNMSSMFQNCTSLEHVPLFNTSKLIDASSMFSGCSSLKEIPLFNIPSIEDMYYMFNDCTNVESGALALYQQASSLSSQIIDHRSTFHNCGSNSTTGAAELAQIPSNWK